MPRSRSLVPYAQASLAAVPALLSACASPLHPAFRHNRYVADYTVTVVNDSLRLSHSALGDMTFPPEDRRLRRRLRRLGLTDVIAYGVTDLEAYYAYYLLLDPVDEPPAEAFDLRADTVVDGRRLVFLARADPDAVPPEDFAFVAASARGRDAYRAEVPSINALLRRSLRSAKYLEALERIGAYPPQDQATAWFQLQLQLTYASMLGDPERYGELRAAYEERFVPREELAHRLNGFAAAAERDYHAALLAVTAETRVVLFAEEHFSPPHRRLLTSLLPALREQGFTHLALEALETDTLLNAGLPPPLTTGFYTREQEYHGLLREGQRLGFEFVAYDDIDAADREGAQASRLHAATLARDSSARVVALVGHSHAYERPGTADDGVAWMAQRLRDDYGLDPLTISQADLHRYRAVADGGALLVPAGALADLRAPRVDYYLLNDLPLVAEADVPDFTYRNRHGREVQVSFYEASGWASAYGYLARVPAVVRLARPGQRVRVGLGEGTWRVVVTDAEGAVLENEAVAPE